MATLIAHIQVKPGMSARFEAVLRDMVRQTEANEPQCLRYEYYRGRKPDFYYCLISFPSKAAFYEHQDSPHHDAHMDDFAACFAGLELEYVDPVEAGGSGLPPTDDPALPADASALMRKREAINPVTVAGWWAALRQPMPPTLPVVSGAREYD